MVKLISLRSIILFILGMVIFSANASSYFYQDEFEFVVYDTEAKLLEYRPKANSSPNVVVPDYITYNKKQIPVKSIECTAFFKQDKIETITFPNTVQQLNGGCMTDCESLREVTFGKNVIVFSPLCFKNCPAVENVYFDKENKKFTDLDGIVYLKDMSEIVWCPPMRTECHIEEGVVNMGRVAFYECHNLRNVYIPSTLVLIKQSDDYGKYIYPSSVKSDYETVLKPMTDEGSYIVPNSGGATDQPFDYCLLLENIYVAEGNPKYSDIDGVWYNADKTKLLRVPPMHEIFEIPDNIIEINWYAFRNNAKFNTFTAPKNITKIPSNLFRNSKSIETVILNSNIKSIQGNAFLYCSSLKSITLPNSITYIADGVFYGCEELDNVTLPSNIKYLGEDVFKNCKSLTSIVIPENVNYISNDAFIGCSSLHTVTFPKKLEYIYYRAFKNCTSLKKVISWAPKAPQLVEATDYNYNYSTNTKEIFVNIPTDAILYVPRGSVESYKNSTGWEVFNKIVELDPITPILSQTELNLKEGETATISVDFISDNSSEIKNHVWTSSDDNIATINENGVVTAYNEGNAILTLSVYDENDNLYNAICNIKVESKIGLSANNIVLSPDESFQLGLTEYDGNIEWSSSDNSIAYVNVCGLITSIGKEGSCIITAKTQDKSYDCDVSVTSTEEATYSLNKHNITNKEDNGNKTEYLEPESIIFHSITNNPTVMNVKLVPDNARTFITWESSDPDVATIDHGLINWNDSTKQNIFTASTKQGHSVQSFLTTSINDLLINNKDKYNVYNLQGICIKEEADKSFIENLPSGIYIINHKKVYIR